LKRGLGGTSIQEPEFLSASFKGDKFHGQTKVSKLAPVNEVTSLSQVDVQQRIGKKRTKQKKPLLAVEMSF
jgi:hypothetical protein